jgi:glutamyl-tRNA synthetase
MNTADSASANAGGRHTTRLAPSPTGTLHLGNARTFLVNWAIARSRGWRIVLRIEDLDLTRVREGAAEQAIDLLRWLGIDWDEGPLWQSHDLQRYRTAMRELAARGLVFASERSRKDIERAASAPNLGDGETRYPPELRPPRDHAGARRFERENVNYRLVVPDEKIEIDDRFAGRSTHHPFHECGDFIVWAKLGVPGYQLAVVVDDARQGVTDVVRGDDLLPSAARQTLLYRALGLAAPEWWHLPLVVGVDGRRLAKRHGDTHLEQYRGAGVSAERVIGLLAALSGVGDRDRPAAMTAAEFRERFSLDMLSRQAERFTPADHIWLNSA